MPPAKQPQQNQSSSRLIGVFISGVIVGLIIGWGWFSLRTDDAQEGAMASSTVKSTTETPSKTNTNTPASTGTKAPTAVSSGTLDVLSQSAGLTVKVSSISVAVPTWVLVMDNNNGTPGNGFGAQMFFPGDKSGTVDLLRPTVAGKSYFVAEFVDNGDHKFSRQTDTQVTGISGAPMLVEFSAQ